MTMKYLSAVPAALLCAWLHRPWQSQPSAPDGVDLGACCGRGRGNSPCRSGIGGVAAIAALSLIAGIQLVKRRRSSARAPDHPAAHADTAMDQ